MKVKVCLDRVRHSIKPTGKKEMAEINNRLPKLKKEIDIKSLAVQVGKHGCSFCCATFTGDKRQVKDMEQIQIFGLDFDHGVTFDEIKNRAKRYNLPIAFAYHTFSSTEEDPRFRIIFAHDSSVEDQRAAKIIIDMLLAIFPEADQQCSDVGRMFLGGKGLIGDVKDESFNIADLAFHFQQYLYEKDEKKYLRNLERFANRHGILVVNNCLQIESVQERKGEMGGKTASIVYIYTTNAIFPPIYRISLSNKTDNIQKSPKESLQIRTKTDEIGSKCRLYNDFVCEDHIPHEDRFLLMTNLINISGGVLLFKEILKKHDYDIKKWKYYIKYAKDNVYLPQSCEGHCRYADSCNHKVNMAVTVQEKKPIIRVEGEEEYYDIEEVYRYVYDCLWKAAEIWRPGIRIIPAQTAIGKTRAYCDLIAEDTEKNYMIAVPTNRLKKEVALRLENLGVDVTVTPSIEDMNFVGSFMEQVNRYYQLGLGQRVTSMMFDYIEENQDAEDREVKNTVWKCREYLNTENCIAQSKVVVTTHARLMTFSENMIQRFVVIVDEDIISSIFKNCYTVSVSDLKKAESSGKCPDLLRMRIKEVLGTKKCVYSKFAETGEYAFLPESELERLMIDTNVNELSTAGSYVIDGEEVKYFCPQRLPQGRYIVLSATADPDLYRMYFRYRDIEVYPYKRAMYKGNLKQLTAYSMSRRCIQIQKKSLVNYLKQYKGSHKIITFMKYEEEFQGSGLHFGNAEGVDAFNGDNLLVVGTPHLSDFIYKLIGCSLGMDVNEDGLTERRITYHGYEFDFMTFKKEKLRSLQLYFISKELEQCIGRARLLRNDCEVVVLSNFPCEQAELIQKDYLEEKKASSETKSVCSPDMAGNLQNI